MQVHTFLAASIADAVTQIRETLGPEAVVLNVRRLPGEGLARWWQKPRIEVLAHVPEKIVEPTAAPMLDEVQVSALAQLRAEMCELRNNLAQPPASSSLSSSNPSEQSRTRTKDEDEDEPIGLSGDWRVGSLLEQTGLLPRHAERIVAGLCASYGEAAPVSLADEIELAKQALTSRWKTSRQNGAGPHVFIGAPGAGKTTALCKWLAQVSLVEGRSAAVWRLDGHIANTAESLSVFGEILGVPVERCVSANGELPDADVLFVDLPGVNPADATALAQLGQRLAAIPGAQVHLVVNAAYETSLLLAQVRAFAALPIQDVIVTHLDEEARWGKVWNLVLGTNCSVRFLAAGQNIPGTFTPAIPEELFAHQFPRKTGVLAAHP